MSADREIMTWHAPSLIDGLGGMGISEDAPEIVMGGRDGQLSSKVVFSENSLLSMVGPFLKNCGFIVLMVKFIAQH